ncbi:MAG: hypothetical protein RLN84_14490 [Rhodospirillaceae bacterium]
MAEKRQNPIIIRKTFNIGAADAESDTQYLKECFIDTGVLETLMELHDPRSIVVGRTGAGKTALLQELKERAENCIELAPETLSLGYISNSNVINFFEGAGVQLDLFYKLLWQHIFTVELLKKKYGIANEQKQFNFLQIVQTLFSNNKNKSRAISYLQEWGRKFWEETQYRTKEFATKLETDLKASASVSSDILSLGAAGARRLSEEERTEVVERGTRVVNSVQIHELHEVMEILANDIFNDPQQRYYVIIDRLDEAWVDEALKYKLVKALIESIKSFRKVANVKIIICLRTDLLARVLRTTQSPGFQEEKYKSLYLNLSWNRDQIARVLDQRVSSLFKRKYTGAQVSTQDVLPKNQIEQRSSLDYLLDRTFFRPREAIMFFNTCLELADGTSRISREVIKKAEVSYSRERIEALQDEWGYDYPLLTDYLKILHHRPAQFCPSDVTDEDIDNFACSFLEAHQKSNDPVFKLCEGYLDDRVEPAVLFMNLAKILYQVGVLGVKPAPHLGRQWSHLDQATLSEGELTPTTTLAVHKAFWAALGVHTKRYRDTDVS